MSSLENRSWITVFTLAKRCLFSSSSSFSTSTPAKAWKWSSTHKFTLLRGATTFRLTNRPRSTRLIGRPKLFLDWLPFSLPRDSARRRILALQFCSARLVPAFCTWMLSGLRWLLSVLLLQCTFRVASLSHRCGPIWVENTLDSLVLPQQGACYKLKVLPNLDFQTKFLT